MNLRSNRSGQTLVEYVLVFAALIGVFFAVQCFARAARRSAEKTTTLVTSEYP